MSFLVNQKRVASILTAKPPASWVDFVGFSSPAYDHFRWIVMIITDEMFIMIDLIVYDSSTFVCYYFTIIFDYISFNIILHNMKLLSLSLFPMLNSNQIMHIFFSMSFLKKASGTRPQKIVSLRDSGVGKCPNYWGFVSHHQNKYLLEMISPIVGWCETLGHSPTPVEFSDLNSPYS